VTACCTCLRMLEANVTCIGWHPSRRQRLFFVAPSHAGLIQQVLGNNAIALEADAGSNGRTNAVVESRTRRRSVRQREATSIRIGTGVGE
jgi:hypothetical protein